MWGLGKPGRAAALAVSALVAGGLAASTALAAGDLRRGEQWGLTMIESDAAHALGATGAGATVAIVDSGVRFTHEDLLGQLALPGADFVKDGRGFDDGNGHGTHVAGIVAANEGNTLGIASVAPGARVLPVRVLDDQGRGTDPNVAAGIRHAVDRGAHVINLSMGEDIPFSALGIGGVVDQAIDYALDRRVVVVAASGNSGLPVCNQPSGQGRLLCVGAVDRGGQKAAYSNFFGQGLGISAPGGSGTGLPGEDILSTYIERPTFSQPLPPRSDSRYEELAGTSQAAPHVAGVAALLVARGLRGQDVVRRILATADDPPPAGPDPVYGAGIVNARRAVTAARDGGLGASGGALVSVRRTLRISYVLRRGVPVRCRGAGNGVCAVRVRAGRRTIASGRTALTAGRAATVRARVTRRGKGVLRRVRRRLGARVLVALPGASVSKPLTLRR
ncbi:MAG: S8 family serine peptidase [Actinomycetota bacterium]|nr:S8 family serine peptidase [Actinomycetota bacterium]